MVFYSDDPQDGTGAADQNAIIERGRCDANDRHEAVKALKHVLSKAQAKVDGITLQDCHVCGKPFWLTPLSISHHYDETTSLRIDHYADGDHIPYAKDNVDE